MRAFAVLSSFCRVFSEARYSSAFRIICTRNAEIEILYLLVLSVLGHTVYKAIFILGLEIKYKAKTTHTLTSREYNDIAIRIYCETEIFRSRHHSFWNIPCKNGRCSRSRSLFYFIMHTQSHICYYKINLNCFECYSNDKEYKFLQINYFIHIVICCIYLSMNTG